MSPLKIYDKTYLNSLYRLRNGEIKIGEKMQTVSSLDEVKRSSARYVLLGIPEDVGVMANYGKRGTAGAWDACLKALLHMQANSHTGAENMVVLGEIDCKAEMKTAALLDPEGSAFGNTIGKLVEKIDVYVAQTIRTIVAAGKVPIVIGGGHNNALGIMKGTSEALGESINVVNLDAHTDFKPLDYRHSGNAFSYAMEHGYLNKYAVFGIHKSFTSQEVYRRMAEFKNKIGFYFFEDMVLEGNPSFEQAAKTAKQFIRFKKFGLEIDVDAIENFPSSAATPTGFTMTQARRFARFFSKNPYPSYIHICEAIPQESELDTVGKGLASLILDVTA